MRTTGILLTLSALALTACGGDDFYPRAKTAEYNPQTGQIDMPYPCPDWSHSSVVNYDNSPHSNFGCTTATNTAQQLAYPEDLAGRSNSAVSDTPDTEITSHIVDQYRSDKIPQPLAPMQASTAGGGGGSE